MLKCRLEFSIFGVLTGIELATSGQIVRYFDQLGQFYIVSNIQYEKMPAKTDQIF